jgi:hypothetical protein
MNKVTFYKAGRQNIETLVEYRLLFALELSGEQPPEAISAFRLHTTEYFSVAMSEGTCISFIGCFEGKVAGIGSVHFREQPGNFINLSGKWGYVMNMYTLPQYRRMGICSGILQHLIDESVKAGITAFELHATKEGEMVYLKNKFEIHTQPTYRRYVSK